MNISREVRRTECAVCDGAGRLSATTESQCAQCQGKGWVRGKNGQEQICPRCDGFQTTKAETTRPCHYCEGRGYVVVLVEVTEVEKQRPLKCPQCEGKGTRRVRRRVDTSECERCGGTGTDMDAANRRGMSLESARCRDCNGGDGYYGIAHVVVDCKRCEGKGQIFEKYFETETRIV